MRRINVGIWIAILSPLLYGITIPLSKGIFLQPTSLGDSIPQAWLLAGLLDVSGGLALLLLSPAVSSPNSPNLMGRDWLWFTGTTFAGGVLAPPLLMLSLAAGQASSSSLLLSIEAPLTVLFAWLFLKERLRFKDLVGVAAVTAGGVILAWTGQISVWAIAAAGAAALWAISHVCTSFIADRNKMQIGILKLVISGAFNVAGALAFGARLPVLQLLLGIAITGFVCNGLSYLAFLEGMVRIGASKAGAIYTVIPVIGAGLSVLFLGEPITGDFVLATVSMTVGIACFAVASQN